MPAEHDLDPGVMTEADRLAKRRYQAYFAFETDPERCVACEAYEDFRSPLPCSNHGLQGGL